jgi:cell division protein FtsL
MIDWSGGSETRNYGIRRIMDRNHLLDLMGFILSILLIAGVIFFQSWVRNRIRSIGYAMNDLQKEEEILVREEENLILEEETLKDPARIDDIARNELGMSRLQPHQIIPYRAPAAGLSGDAALAMADTQETKTTGRRAKTN